MNDHLKNNLAEVDKDLSHSWIDLSEKVRDLAADLKLKTAGTAFAAEADHLSIQTARLCNHVAKLHADVIDFIENIETHVPLQESDAVAQPINDLDALNQEKIQIQREKHELRNDFKDVIKALFMWVDDPKERLRSKL
ncbi:MAG: hypothetical protein V4727_04795 [Verrucomicrobiota bacterium]